MDAVKLWIDDVRDPPSEEGWVIARSVDDAIGIIKAFEASPAFCLALIDIDHDAGNFRQFGGDFIKVLDWLEETGRVYPIRIHSLNPVGVTNMRRIINKNHWKEIF